MQQFRKFTSNNFNTLMVIYGNSLSLAVYDLKNLYIPYNIIEFEEIWKLITQLKTSRRAIKICETQLCIPISLC